jgi:Na+-driven multidrug efflux pump
MSSKPSYGAIRGSTAAEPHIPSAGVVFRATSKKFLFIVALAACDFSTTFSESYLLSKSGVDALAALALIFKINILVDSFSLLVSQNSVFVAGHYGQTQRSNAETRPLLKGAKTQSSSALSIQETQMNDGQPQNITGNAASLISSDDLNLEIEIGKILRQGWMLAILVSIIPGVSLGLFTDKMISKMGVDNEVSGRVGDYYQRAAGAIPFMLMNQINERFLSAVNQEKWLLPYSILTTIIGLTLNFTLIPKYEARGAGWSVLIQAVSSFLLSTLFLSCHPHFKKYEIWGSNICEHHHGPSQRPYIYKTFKQGFPMFLAVFLVGTSVLAVSFFIHHLGKLFLAIDHAISQWLAFTYIAYHSWGEASNRLIAQEAGNKQLKASKRYGDLALLSSATLYLFIVLIFNVLSVNLVRFFIKNEDLTVDDKLIRISFLLKSVIDFAFSIYDTSNLNLAGLQDTLCSALALSLPMLLLILPLSALSTFMLNTADTNISQYNNTTQADDRLYAIYGSYVFGISIAAFFTCRHWMKQSSNDEYDPDTNSSNANPRRFFCCRQNKATSEEPHTTNHSNTEADPYAATP